MGRKTSVYLADDIIAALAADPRPLAEIIRAGLGIGPPPPTDRTQQPPGADGPGCSLILTGIHPEPPAP